MRWHRHVPGCRILCNCSDLRHQHVRTRLYLWSNVWIHLQGCYLRIADMPILWSNLWRRTHMPESTNVRTNLLHCLAYVPNSNLCGAGDLHGLSHVPWRNVQQGNLHWSCDM